MTTVDKLLLKITTNTTPTIEECISKRDSRVLRSLASAVSGPNFITENQSNLLLKILRENSKKITFLTDEETSAVVDPRWSKMFRPVDKTKKLYISKNYEGDLVLVVEYAFSSTIRRILNDLTKKLDNGVVSINTRIYHIELTERNVVLLVEAFKPQDFQIDELIKTHYDTIKSWSESEVKNQFLITSITNQHFQRHITEDLGLTTSISDNVLKDRSMRYHYYLEKSEKIPENLTEILASRSRTKIWVDKNKFSLDDIFNSLIELKRLPLLVVFESHNIDAQLKNLKNLSEILEKNSFASDVGIYFRLPGAGVGKEFNDLISERKYNSVLGKQTKIVGVQNGKIPKFFLKNEWKPMSVVSLGTPLRHSKTSVYANCCDLIIQYSETDYLIEA